MILTAGVAILTVTFVYTYSTQILVWGIYVLSKTFKMYLYVYDKLGWSKNSIHLHEKIKLDESVHLHRYKTVINKKPHYISVVNLDNKKKIFESVKTNFDLRTKFLHCSIMDEHDCAVDLTQSLREFVYHYDKDDHHSKLYYFFRYVQHKCKTSFELLHEYDFVLYMNDDSFTEKRYSVRECLDKRFMDVIESN
jgi:hypothetical protein